MKDKKERETNSSSGVIKKCSGKMEISRLEKDLLLASSHPLLSMLSNNRFNLAYFVECCTTVKLRYNIYH